MSEGSRPPNPSRAPKDEQPLARPAGDEELRLARPVSGEQEEEEEEATQAQAEQQETTQTEAAKEEGRQVEGEQEEEKGLIEKVKDKLQGQ